jgi:hypothetical protein
VSNLPDTSVTLERASSASDGVAASLHIAGYACDHVVIDAGNTDRPGPASGTGAEAPL